MERGEGRSQLLAQDLPKIAFRANSVIHQGDALHNSCHQPSFEVINWQLPELLVEHAANIPQFGKRDAGSEIAARRFSKGLMSVHECLPSDRS